MEDTLLKIIEDTLLAASSGAEYAGERRDILVSIAARLFRLSGWDPATAPGHVWVPDGLEAAFRAQIERVEA